MDYGSLALSWLFHSADLKSICHSLAAVVFTDIILLGRVVRVSQRIGLVLVYIGSRIVSVVGVDHVKYERLKKALYAKPS